MRFYGRESEIGVIRSRTDDGRGGCRITVVTSPRRHGLTTTVLKALEDRRHVFLPVTRQSDPVLGMDMVHLASGQGFQLPPCRSLPDVLRGLMRLSGKGHLIAVIDDIDESYSQSPAVLSALGEVWRDEVSSSNLDLVVTGHTEWVLRELFSEEGPMAHPDTEFVPIGPLSLKEIKGILHDHNPDCRPGDLIALYAVAGGSPARIGMLMDGGNTTEDSIIGSVSDPSSPLISDIRLTMAETLGYRSRAYRTILRCIARGVDRKTDIEMHTGIPSGKYLSQLELDYWLIRPERSVFSRFEFVRFSIPDPSVLFHFAVVEPVEWRIAMGDGDALAESVRRNIQSCLDRALVSLLRMDMAERNPGCRVGGMWSRDEDTAADVVVRDDEGMTGRFYSVISSKEELEGSVERLSRFYEGYRVSFGTLGPYDLVHPESGDRRWFEFVKYRYVPPVRLHAGGGVRCLLGCPPRPLFRR